MNTKKELTYQLTEAVRYIESMKESISTSVNERAGDWIYSGMDNALEFDVKAAKNLLAELEVSK
jgi:hypothetical protein